MAGKTVWSFPRPRLLVGLVAIVSSLTASRFRPRTSGPHFDYWHFERLPNDERLPEAQKYVDALFPPGTEVSNFQSYFERSGAICVTATDRDGPAVVCNYNLPVFSLVTTTWVVVARLIDDTNRIKSVGVYRNLTGM